MNNTEINVNTTNQAQTQVNQSLRERVVIALGRVWHCLASISFTLMSLVNRIMGVSTQAKPFDKTAPTSTPAPIKPERVEIVVNTSPILDPSTSPLNGNLPVEPPSPPPSPPRELKEPAAPAKKIEPARPPFILKTYPNRIIEAGGGGDCQLWSILMGLQRHPDQEVKNIAKEYDSPQKLRMLGINFMREQVATNGPHVKLLQDCIINNWENYKLELEEDHIKTVKSLYDAAKKKILSKGEYDKRLENQRNSYNTKKAYFDQYQDNYVEGYLKMAEKKGFFCDNFHIAALSGALNLPIRYISDKTRVGNPTMFNLNNSTKKPINLYFCGNHFQYIHFLTDAIDK